FYAVHAALRTLASRADVEEMESNAAAREIIAVEYYNLQGMKTGSDTKGLVIERTLYSDGSVESRKIIRD
ncbi:MAG: hypothetical protein K2H49_08710, partial [Muribaculaceae bacterium]|nr:hypothetical protein [Muribaculaceae bacterium]